MSTSDPDEIRANIERTRADLSHDVDEFGDKVSPSQVAHRQADRLRDSVTQVKDRVMGSAHDLSTGSAHGSSHGSAHGSAHGVADRGREAASSAADSARHAASSVAGTVGSAPRAVREQAQGNPLGVGLVAFGVGLVVASLLPSSRTEQRTATAVREKTEPLVDDVKAAASEVAHDLEQPAREGAEAVRDAAKEAAGSVGQHGREAVDDIRSRATGNG